MLESTTKNLHSLIASVHWCSFFSYWIGVNCVRFVNVHCDVYCRWNAMALALVNCESWNDQETWYGRNPNISHSGFLLLSSNHCVCVCVCTFLFFVCFAIVESRVNGLSVWIDLTNSCNYVQWATHWSESMSFYDGWRICNNHQHYRRHQHHILWPKSFSSILNSKWAFANVEYFHRIFSALWINFLFASPNSMSHKRLSVHILMENVLHFLFHFLFPFSICSFQIQLQMKIPVTFAISMFISVFISVLNETKTFCFANRKETEYFCICP